MICLNGNLLTVTLKLIFDRPYQQTLDKQSKGSLIFSFKLEKIFNSFWSDELKMKYKDFITLFFDKKPMRELYKKFSLKKFINNQGFNKTQKKHILGSIPLKLDISNSKIMLGCRLKPSGIPKYFLSLFTLLMKNYLQSYNQK